MTADEYGPDLDSTDQKFLNSTSIRKFPVSRKFTVDNFECHAITVMKSKGLNRSK